jgi:hypothetical protein
MTGVLCAWGPVAADRLYRFTAARYSRVSMS